MCFTSLATSLLLASASFSAANADSDRIYGLKLRGGGNQKQQKKGEEATVQKTRALQSNFFNLPSLDFFGGSSSNNDVFGGAFDSPDTNDFVNGGNFGSPDTNDFVNGGNFGFGRAGGIFDSPDTNGFGFGFGFDSPDTNDFIFRSGGGIIKNNNNNNNFGVNSLSISNDFGFNSPDNAFDSPDFNFGNRRRDLKKGKQEDDSEEAISVDSADDS